MADPDGHRHRLVGCQEARALASALGCARIGHSDTLQSLMPSHLSLTLPVRSRSRAAELESKRCCSRVSHDAFDPLSSTSDRSAIASVVCNGAPAGDIARWTPLSHRRVESKASGRHLCCSVGHKTRSDVQIRCSIDRTHYLTLPHVPHHTDTLTCNRTSGLVGSRPYSACNTSPTKPAGRG